MSLILEALRKLEREKEVTQRGFLVLPPTQGAPRRSRFLWPLALVPLALGAGLLLRVARRPQTKPATLVVAPPSLPRPPEPEASKPVEPGAGKPTSPPASPGAAPTFVLQAISERDGEPVAVLNDRLVKAGDTLLGARVVAIGADSVELELKGRRQVVRF